MVNGKFESSKAAISIVMPLLDAMPYLHDALASISEQNVLGLEVIAIDGGSTDGTRELLQEHTRSESTGSFIVVDAPGLSQTAALNLGFSRASGEIFGWLNGDDLLAEGALAWVVGWFEENPDAGLVYGDSMAINEKGRAFGIRSNVRGGQYQQLLHGDFIVQPSCFWRSSVFKEVGPLDESLHYAFDYAYFLDVAKHRDLHFEPIILSFERLRGGAKTAQGGELRAAELLAVMSKHGRDRVPMAFQPEVSALQAHQALRAFGSGDRREALTALRSSFAEGRPLFYMLAHLVASIAGGPSGTAQARLASNWIRARSANRPTDWPSSRN